MAGIDIHELSERRQKHWLALSYGADLTHAAAVETLTKQLEDAYVEKRRAAAQRRAST